MSTGRADLEAVVAGLQARWGAAAPRTLGALALAPAAALALAPALAPARTPAGIERSLPGDGRVIPTGFAALDVILGPGGLPRSASVAVRGDGSSGRTTLALRVAAEAQARGAVVAWLDLDGRFEPLEAASRGVRLDRLALVTPTDLDEGLRIAGSLVAGRSVDLLVLDLPGSPMKPGGPSRVADSLRRLAAVARRAETLLLVLDAPSLTSAVDAATAIRLELRRRSWIRLGRRVVGLDAEVLVAHNRHGPSGRHATLRILYAQGSERDACLTRPDLLTDAPTHREADHATPPLLRAASRPGPGAGPPLRALPAGTLHPRRSTVGSGHGHRRRSGGASDGRPAQDAPRQRPSARP